MKFELENFGPIKKANIELGDLTIICGRNNTGKTCLAYVIYDFMKFLPGNVNFKINSFKPNDQNTCSFDLSKLLPDAREGIKKASASFAKNNMPGATFSVTDIDSSFDINFTLGKDEVWSMQNVSFVVNKEKSLISIKRKEIPVKESTGTKQDSSANVSIQAFARNFAKMCFFSSRFQAKLFGDFFAVTTERTGVSVFRKIINIGNMKIVQGLQNYTAGKISSDRFKITAEDGYPDAIQSNLEYVNKLEDICKQDSFLMKEKKSSIRDLLQDIVCGTYEILPNDVINFVPQSRTDLKLPMKKSSSSVRALLLLDCYLRYSANKYDTLFIDEPELNLHPENQRKLARLLAMLVNAGVRIFITTHSDYIVREFDFMTRLYKNKALGKKLGYSNEQLLCAEQVKTYVTNLDPATNQYVLREIPVSEERGIESESFDNSIEEMNYIHQSIQFGDIMVNDDYILAPKKDK